MGNYWLVLVILFTHKKTTTFKWKKPQQVGLGRNLGVRFILNNMILEDILQNCVYSITKKGVESGKATKCLKKSSIICRSLKWIITNTFNLGEYCNFHKKAKLSPKSFVAVCTALYIMCQTPWGIAWILLYSVWQEEHCCFFFSFLFFSWK